MWIDNITRIENGEPASGGVAGVANRALIQLAERTRYLKKCCDASGLESYKGYLVVCSHSSPYLYWYGNNAENYTILDNPAGMPEDIVNDCKFSSGGYYVAVGKSNSPRVLFYKRYGKVLTPLSNPSVLPIYDTKNVSWSSDNKYVACAGNTDTPSGTDPTLSIYRKDAGDAFTYMQSPILNISNIYKSCNSVSYSQTSDHLAVAVSTGVDSEPAIITFVGIVDGTAILDRLIDLPSGPQGNGICAKWSHDGKYLFTSSTTDFTGTTYFTGSNGTVLKTYERSNNNFTLIDNFDGVPAESGSQPICSNVVASPSGKYLAIMFYNGAAGAGGEQLLIYERSGDNFTRVLHGIDCLEGLTNVVFTQDDSAMILTYASSIHVTNNIDMYRIGSQNVFTQITDPDSDPGNWVMGADYYLS